MKTNLQNVRLIALLIAVTATLVTQSVNAQNFSFTETSPAILTASFTAPGVTFSGSVTNNGPDSWTVAFPGLNMALFSFNPPQAWAWAEPENSSLANVVSWNASTFNFTVSSDIATSLMVHNDGETIAGIAVITGAQFTSATFKDNAATAEPQTAPDTGSTLGLLSLALAGLFGSSRIRSLRLA